MTLTHVLIIEWWDEVV